MCKPCAIRLLCSAPPGTRALSGVGVLSTSLLLLITPLRLSAAPLAYPTEEFFRCGDQAETSLSQEPRRDDCISVWVEELQKEYQDRDTTSWWKDFHLGPQALSEQELRFLYPPDERRQLLGY